MFSWNFAKSAEAVFSRLAIKKVCKFLLKKKLGQLILGDIDLNQLDVQLSNGTIQLSDLALNVDFINQKFGEASILVVKEGSIGSLTVRLPWKGRNCEIEVEELEIVLAPGRKRSSEVGNEPSTSGQDGNTYTSHGFMTPEHGMVDSTMTNPSVDIHEGVKTIAKMVKWLLTSFHVKIKKLIVALDRVSEEGHGRTLVLRFGEVECGTGISDEVNVDHQGTVDGFLGLSRLTNFVKFDGAVLEFLQLDGNGNATTPVITGEKGGFSGTIKLSIPWKNGSLDIRKVDADVFIDPIELRLQPRTIKSFMYFMNVFEELENDHKSFMGNKPTESVYYNASFHGYSSEFSSDKLSQKPETESYLDALLRGSHLISDWMTSPVTSNQDPETEEPDFGASVDQFFECFDELRTSQSALGNSGMWNWTCSVFSAISAASNLASGSLHIPSEQKHVETSLKARMARIVILFSFVDEDQKPSCVHYINGDFHEMQLVLQVCPRESNFEATVKLIEVADHFRNASQKETMNSQALLIKKKQAAVEDACPPLSFVVQGDASDVSTRGYRGIYSDDVAKVLVFKTSGVTQCQFITPSVSQDLKSQPKSFSVKLPPLVFWVNFHLISTVLNLFKEIEKSHKINIRKDLSASISGDAISKGSQREALRGNISLMDARILFCFPCDKNEDYKTYLSWNKFIVVDISSPLYPREGKSKSSQSFRVTPTRSLHLSVGNIAVYFVASDITEKFTAERVLSVFDKTGHLSVLSIIWQDNAVTGPWITKKAKILSTSDGTTSRNKSTGKGHGLAFVTTTKDMEDFNTQTRQEMVSTSSFSIHAHLSPVTINLNGSLYQKIHNLSQQVSGWLSHIAPNPVATSQKLPSSQSSIFLECNIVEISVALEGIKDSIQYELPGSWCNLKLKVGNFELLTVSNIGGISGANFLWVAHGEGDLLGSTTEVSGKNFVLISCENSTRGRGNGEGSNILSSRFPGSDIIHLWDPHNLVSQLSINIRCATIVAIGGRLDWFDSITSFFSQISTESDQKEDTNCGSYFVLNLIDIGLSYEPYVSNHTSQQDSEQCVSGLLAASSLKLSNVSSPNSIEKQYVIKAHDLGLLICEESGVKNLVRSYSEQNLRKSGYVKVAEETHIEAILRTNCGNGHEWEMECHESHIMLETCQDSTSGLARLAAQIQQIFAPDVEESIVHLQTRWDNFQLEQESYRSRSSSHHSTSSSEVHESYAGNLMDEISEGAFDLNGNHEFVPPVKVPVRVYGLEDNGPEFIDGYFNNQSTSGKTVILKETEGQVRSGWYGDSLLTIVEDHVLGNAGKTNSKKRVESESSESKKVKGRVLLKNMDVRWTLYGGSHWQYTTDTCTRNKDIGLEFKLSKLGFQYDMFPDGEISVSRLSVSVHDFSLNDVSNNAPWRQILGCYQSKDCPRESRSRALKLDLESVRPRPSIPLEEYRLQIAILPMRLHLHQCQLEFLINFFGGKSSSPDHSQDTVEIDMPEEALLPYFQKFSITPVVVRVDYIPSRVDLPALGHGKYVELVNLFQWKGVELQLKHVQAVGVYGWSTVCETIIGEWLEDISQNQVHKLLKGLPPIRSLVAIGSSAAKLVSLPVKNYKKDRRLVKGMQRGTIGFLRSVSLEAIGLGAHLAAGVHAILLQAEDIISTSPPTSIPKPIQTRVNPYGRSSQPKDARQGIQQAFETMNDGIGRSASALVQTPLKKYQRGAGVGSALSTAVQAAPGAAIAPASAAARAMHSALLGVRNSLDPEHKKDSMDKYLGTTQSQPL